jgi:hypothetical protein
LPISIGAHVAPDLLAVVELAEEDFTDQHRGNLRSDAPDLHELLNLLDQNSDLPRTAPVPGGR